MKISISNIAWDASADMEMYDYLQKYCVEGLEIAPTRIFAENPYERLEDAKEYGKKIREKYGMRISSIQSIWYGRTEKIFEDSKQREILIEYTNRAFAFAHALECENLVFGCPRNRNINSEDDKKIAVEFFTKLGENAKKEGTVLALEANPPIYNTNFLNTTQQVNDLIEEINTSGIKMNYDFGTVIENKEAVGDVKKYMNVINHVHISEPYLEEIQYTEKHRELLDILKTENYDRYVSIEMKNLNNVDKVKNALEQLIKLMRS